MRMWQLLTGLTDYRAATHALLVYGAAGMLFCATQRLASQSIDSVVTSASRSPISIADEIQDPAERSAFVTILQTTDPAKLFALSRSFLLTYPRSAFLAQAADAAARSSFDLGELTSGLDYAHLSLSLLPENPLLLVAVADVQALLQQNEAAIASANDALEYLDRFDHPAKVPERDWPKTKRIQQGTAWFVIGRALTMRHCKRPPAFIECRCWSGQRPRLSKPALSSLETWRSPIFWALLICMQTMPRGQPSNSLRCTSKPGARAESAGTIVRKL